MKLLNLIVLASAPLLVIGCRTDQDDSHGTARSAHEGSGDSEAKDKQPKVGMTEAQIRDMYGEPDSINHSARGDVWHYWFNSGHAFIPYNFGYSARTGDFIFDANGVLKDFNYNE
jgi:outer membrane protein assembly factor BamE (lipoprotein component of BamABCDE complex)